jgi:hypothetical protein
MRSSPWQGRRKDARGIYLLPGKPVASSHSMGLLPPIASLPACQSCLNLEPEPAQGHGTRRPACSRGVGLEGLIFILRESQVPRPLGRLDGGDPDCSSVSSGLPDGGRRRLWPTPVSR